MREINVASFLYCPKQAAFVKGGEYFDSAEIWQKWYGGNYCRG